MFFSDELVFENTFVQYLLKECGWQEVIKRPTEEDLIKNWAEIIFDNNKQTDILNGCKLTSSEMDQIINQINLKRSSVELNRFINDCYVAIIRDNKEDQLHFNQEVHLKIFDKDSIAGGSSVYQIVEQPIFKTNNSAYPKKRGDVMLLINGMPLFHIELKRSNVSITQAENQIKKYSDLNCFSGIYSLIQIFVAMNPEQAVYFANPGKAGIFNPDFYFRWEDFNNEIVNSWDKFTKDVLSIPLAHEFISYYTVADKSDNVLKVMRSYQLFATREIKNIILSHDWFSKKQVGGFIWHTTGSGKTMTSFKAAQLIAASNKADKVIFLIDRIELGNQSYESYKNYANNNETVQETEDTKTLISKLKSDDKDCVLIVTSIQKMSRITLEDGVSKSDLEKIQKKKLVFIVDECHRDQKGDMNQTIKRTFNKALFFGFTGTPEHEVTADIFGDELHRYTIVQGVRDKNVLGFDPYFISTWQDKKIRREIGLRKCGAKDEKEVFKDQVKKLTYLAITKEYSDLDVENLIPNSQYFTDDKNDDDLSNSHTEGVVKDILDNWLMRSNGNTFHALFTVESINKAIKYYKLFKTMNSDLNITAVFDPSDTNESPSTFKIEGINEILTDYNKKYETNYNIGTYYYFKKDVCDRLSHKNSHKNLIKNEYVNIVIVVEQLLTGFDSKWINTLYFDKEMHGMNLIQAISRTNRIYDFNEKPFGTLIFYYRPELMKINLNKAIGEYAGTNHFSIFVDKLKDNLKSMNKIFKEIKDIFESNYIYNFEKLPDDNASKAKFAKSFLTLFKKYKSAKIQGFYRGQLEYKFVENGVEDNVKLDFDENTFNILLQRYKELLPPPGPGPGGDKEPPYDIDQHIIEEKGDKIDYDYMKSKRKFFLKTLESGNPEDRKKAEEELHKTFASLSKEEQVFAEQILIDLNNGNLKVDSDKTLKDYIEEYMINNQNTQIKKLSDNFGIDFDLLNELLSLHVSEKNLNQFGRYDKLKENINIDKARTYLEKRLNKNLPSNRSVMAEVDKLLRDFIINGGGEI